MFLSEKYKVLRKKKIRENTEISVTVIEIYIYFFFS